MPTSLPARIRLAARRRQLRGAPRPRHVGLVMDGNRRWARLAGFADARVGHRAGAEHVGDVLRWATTWGIDHLTVYVLSADNIRKRPVAEVDHLMTLLEEIVPEQVLAHPRWCAHVSGDERLLPSTTRESLAQLVDATRGRPAHVTLAIAYDGHEDIVTGIRAALIAAAETRNLSIGEDDVTRGLPGGPVKEIDLVIRTSGEQRLSGFFPWQASNAQIVLSPKLWPAFTEVDFADALAEFARSSDRRHRMAG
ncbi:polyprenyl diphosphate synthase [Nocardioides sp. CN2-186]|uniref:polyprenyl diphosphate synthase n=1 Tax=Nocardioides tweenelious TaxID=3156607 RepID=UPI0032B3DFCB